MIAVRKALPEDETYVFVLARDLATSYQVNRSSFSSAYSHILASPDVCLMVALSSANIIGYVLGISHVTFYANGNVAWMEEIMVKEDFHGRS
jgi:hypothetical protein